MSPFDVGRDTPDARAATVKQLLEAFAAGELEIKAALAGPDPWAADYGVRTLSVLDVAARELKHAVARALPDLSDIARLQQAWSVATAKPAWAALISSSPAAKASSSCLTVAARASGVSRPMRKRLMKEGLPRTSLESR